MTPRASQSVGGAAGPSPLPGAVVPAEFKPFYGGPQHVKCPTLEEKAG